jgi:hypothetical protein
LAGERPRVHRAVGQIPQVPLNCMHELFAVWRPATPEHYRTRVDRRGRIRSGAAAAAEGPCPRSARRRGPREWQVQWVWRDDAMDDGRRVDGLMARDGARLDLRRLRCRFAAAYRPAAGLSERQAGRDRHALPEWGSPGWQMVGRRGTPWRVAFGSF